uniref:Hydrolase_4 domain-containing protein n=2 Tax=Caenorhabditis tropicalis TaxID=1561998 RepID=A0A1I7UVM9_9PELO
MGFLNKLNVLYCHGLGSSINCRHATQLQSFFEKEKDIYFERFLYKNPGSYEHIWNVNEWRKDIEERIDSNDEKWILTATSGACHPALNIAKQRKSKIAGLFLMCPGTGLDMSFVDTIQPGALKYLMKVGTIKYPPSKHGHPALLNIECLQEFLKTDICNSAETTIDITCPVLTVHGVEDNIVPVENSNRLMQRISSTCKDFYRIPGVDHYFDLDEKVLTKLEKLMNSIRENEVPEKKRSKI